MDFELSDEQRLLTDSARAFAARELAPHAADWDRDHHFPVEVIRRAAEQGYAQAQFNLGSLAPQSSTTAGRASEGRNPA